MENITEMELERMAEIQHEIWVHWMKYFFTRIQIVFPEPLGRHSPQKTLIILKSDFGRWVKQMGTKYSDLSESEKEADRKIVKRYIMKGT